MDSGGFTTTLRTPADPYCSGTLRALRAAPGWSSRGGDAWASEGENRLMHVTGSESACSVQVGRLGPIPMPMPTL